MKSAVHYISYLMIIHWLTLELKPPIVSPIGSLKRSVRLRNRHNVCHVSWCRGVERHVLDAEALYAWADVGGYEVLQCLRRQLLFVGPPIDALG